MNPQNKQSEYDVYAAIGRMTVRFNDLNKVLNRNLISKLKINGGEVSTLLNNWQNGTSFHSLIKEYENGPKIFKNYHKTLDKIRRQRNDIIHNTVSNKLSEKQVNRCTDVCNMIDGVIGGLKHETDHFSSKNQNSEKGLDRKTLLKVIKQCKPDEDGDIPLTTLGKVLKNNNIAYRKGKLRDECEKFGFETVFAETRPGNKTWYVRIRQS